MKLTRIFASLAFLAVGLQAQNNDLRQPPAQLTASTLARDEATTALKAGNPQAALAKVRGATVRDGVVAEDVQVVTSVASIARGLAAEQHPASRDAALLAIAEADKAKGRLNSYESAYVEAQIGGVYEKVLGDAAKAKELYRLALARDGSRKDAEAGLQRIERFEALAEAKARENEELRRQAK